MNSEVPVSSGWQYNSVKEVSQVSLILCSIECVLDSQEIITSFSIVIKFGDNELILGLDDLFSAGELCGQPGDLCFEIRNIFSVNLANFCCSALSLESTDFSLEIGDLILFLQQKGRIV